MTNKSNFLYYLIIIAVIYYLLKKYNLIEKFHNRGIVSYLDQHNYLNCCRKYGCRNFRCKRFIKNRIGKNRPQRIGFIKHTKEDGDHEIYILYKQKDYRNINKYKYFYNKKNKIIKLETRNLKVYQQHKNKIYLVNLNENIDFIKIIFQKNQNPVKYFLHFDLYQY